ncbi:MAG: TIGR01841 family phasin [Alphaproteobacteria bacterium]|nr:TIGR01841 family phasin [Alphaproteobacteria bacterium]MBV9695038.1 TIGR01841 family phasin [Alphaproteobacteria bacterium]
MAKHKTHGEKTTDAAQDTVNQGAEALKANFEKAFRGYDHVLGYGQETMDAYLKAANAAGKGAETIQNEIFAWSRQSVEDSITAAKAVMASKSVHEAIELQTDFARTAFEGYVNQMTKLGEIMVAATRDSFAPLQGRVQAWVDTVQTTRAA